MSKTSKIEEIVKIKEREGDKGTVFYFTVKMENGDEYPIKKGKMKKDGYTVGQELNYNVEKDGEYDKIFVVEPQREFKGYTPAPKNYPADFVSMGMAFCKDLVVAGKVEYKDLNKCFDNVYGLMIDKLLGGK